MLYNISIKKKKIANDSGYKILRFWANPQKYQTLVPAKNSHLASSIKLVRACARTYVYMPRRAHSNIYDATDGPPEPPVTGIIDSAGMQPPTPPPPPRPSVTLPNSLLNKSVSRIFVNSYFY
jgi:hypothetical protein